MAALRSTAKRTGRVLAVFLTFAAMFSVAESASAQEPGAGEVSIYFVAFACPETAEDPYVNCDILDGASYSIEADGVALAGSPFTTAPTSLVPGFTFNAPEDATLTITQLSGNPAGYAPAAGYDPYVVAVADLPEVGCGGESTCPGVEFFNVPFAVADGPADDETEISDDTVLPNTGAGPIASDMTGTSALLAGLAVMLGMGALRVRRQTVR